MNMISHHSDNPFRFYGYPLAHPPTLHRLLKRWLSNHHPLAISCQLNTAMPGWIPHQLAATSTPTTDSPLTTTSRPDVDCHVDWLSSQNERMSRRQPPVSRRWFFSAVSMCLPPPPPPSHLNASWRWFFLAFRPSPITTTSLASKRKLEVITFNVSTVSQHHHLPRI